MLFEFDTTLASTEAKAVEVEVERLPTAGPPDVPSAVESDERPAAVEVDRLLRLE